MRRVQRCSRSMRRLHIGAQLKRSRSTTQRNDARSTNRAGKQQVLAGRLLKHVKFVPIASLVANPRNARRHSQEQRHRLEFCISNYGFLIPILIDEVGNIVLGHARVLAARNLGMTEVPALVVTGLSSVQIRAFAIAENRISDMAEWDNEALRVELAELIVLGVEVEAIAFSTGEADIVLDGDNGPSTNAENDPMPPDLEGTAVSQNGDIWHLGPHRLLCGNALEDSDYDLLMRGLKASTVIADPPYNVPINGFVSGLGRTKHREFGMASGEMSPAQFTTFLATAFALLTRYSRRGSLHYFFMDWRHLREILDAGYEAYTELKNVCVWNKSNAGMGSFYRSKHELVFVFQNGLGGFQNNVELGVHGRYRTNVWDYAGMNSIGERQAGELAMHPTVKPVALIADAIRDCTKRGELVLDPFVGSGTTILAAERVGRICAAMELDPLYVDVAVRRWEMTTGIPARLGSNETFQQVRGRRTGGAQPSHEIG